MVVGLMNKSYIVVLGLNIFLAVFILGLSIIYIFPSIKQEKSFILNQSPIDCVNKECTVSPIKKYSSDGNFEAVYPDADFANLDQALEAVKNQGGAKLLLLANKENLDPGTGGYNSHYITMPEMQSVVLTKSIHIKGEETNEISRRMPTIRVAYSQVKTKEMVEQQRNQAYGWCIDASRQPYDPYVGNTKAINGIMGMYQLKLKDKGFYDGSGSAETLCHQITQEEFPNSLIGQKTYHGGGLLPYSPLVFASNQPSSIIKVSFDIRLLQPQNLDMDYYNNIDNVISLIKVENSNLDIKECVFSSHWNTDVSEVSIPTSQEQVRKNRVAVAIYINSRGNLELNRIEDAWAGGFLVKENSDLTIKYNQFNTQWFGVASINSNLKVLNNIFYTINGLRFMGDIRPGGTGWRGLKEKYPNWIGPLAIWDYPVNGIWQKGGTIEAKQNTIGEYVTPIKMVETAGVIDKNAFFITESSFSESMVIDSPNLSLLDNETYLGARALHEQLDQMNGCLDVDRNIGMDSLGGNTFCMTMPKASADLAKRQLGALYGSDAGGWNGLELYKGEIGCKVLPRDWFSGISCAQGLECKSSETCLLPEDSGTQGGSGPTRFTCYCQQSCSSGSSCQLSSRPIAGWQICPSSFCIGGGD